MINKLVQMLDAKQTAPVRAAAETKETVDDLGFKLMRKGVKEAAKDTLLTPR